MPIGNIEIVDKESETWVNDKERLEFYFSANDMTDANKKKALFYIVWLKKKLWKLQQSWFSLNHLKVLFDEVFNKLSNHFEPRKNELCVGQLFYNHCNFDIKNLTLEVMKNNASSKKFSETETIWLRILKVLLLRRKIFIV